jgi:hypothetical protein
VPFGDDQFAVAIEVTEQMAAAHPHLLHIVDLFATAPRKADMPWCFCDDDNNYKPNPEALHAWRELAYAAYRFISPISFTAPLERVPLDRNAPIPAPLHADRSVVTPFMSNPTEQHALARVARPSLLANPPRTLPPLSPPQPRPRTRSFTRSHTHAHSASADSPNIDIVPHRTAGRGRSATDAPYRPSQTPSSSRSRSRSATSKTTKRSRKGQPQGQPATSSSSTSRPDRSPPAPGSGRSGQAGDAVPRRSPRNAKHTASSQREPGASDRGSSSGSRHTSKSPGLCPYAESKS